MRDKYIKKFEKKGYYLSNFYYDSDFEKCDNFKLIDVNEELLSSIIRGEKQLITEFKSEFVNEAIFLKLEKSYHIKLRDLLSFLEKEKFKDENIDMKSVKEGLLSILNFKIHGMFVYERYFFKNINIKEDPFLENEDNVIKVFMKSILHDYMDDYFPTIDDSILILNNLLKQNELPREDRKYHEKTICLLLFIMRDDMDKIHDIKIKDEVREFYIENVKKLANKGNFYAMTYLGFDYYLGEHSFGINIKKAEELFLKAINLKPDPYLANVLGYIYYYGRNNNGVPDYDKSFKYFAIAHISKGIFEATYKLSDCFKHGYGTTKDEKTAYQLVNDIYAQNHYYYLRDDTSKYADVALRMALFYKDGIGVKKDIKQSYKYFLSARTAIKNRIKTIDYVGDIGVANSINKSILELKKEFNGADRLIDDKYNGYILNEFKNLEYCYDYDIKVEEISDLVLKIFIKPYQYDEEEEDVKYTEITFENYSINEKVNELEFVVKIKDKISKQDRKIFEKEVIQKITISKSTIVFTFECAKDEKVIGFNVDKIVYIPKSIKDIHKNYHVVSVAFNEGGKLYDYLDPKKSASVGDKVIVESRGSFKEVKVMEVKDVYEDELSLPLNKMSEIK